MAKKDTTAPKEWKPRSPRPGKDVVERRLRDVTRWLVDGARTTRIYALAEESAKIEREATEAARVAGTPLPPFVWDVTPRLSTRQIDKYLAKIRATFERDGRELTKKSAEVLGLTWLRSNDLYFKALDAGRYATCRMILRDQWELFGLIGAIKVQLVAPTDADATANAANLPESEYTAEQLAHEWRALIEVGLQRVRSGGLAPVAKALGTGSTGDNSIDSDPARIRRGSGADPNRV